VDVFGRICPVVSDLSSFERKFVWWCRICPVVSDWFVGFSVGFSEWQSSRAGSCRPGRRDKRATLHWLRPWPSNKCLRTPIPIRRVK
jgi:hypothetical protein